MQTYYYINIRCNSKFIESDPKYYGSFPIYLSFLFFPKFLPEIIVIFVTLFSKWSIYAIHFIYTTDISYLNVKIFTLVYF